MCLSFFIELCDHFLDDLLSSRIVCDDKSQYIIINGFGI
jgi:hypothetical protein